MFIRLLVWFVAIVTLVVMMGSCNSIRNAPADATLLAGTGASVAIGTAVGGPAGAAIALGGTVASAIATEELVRPATAPCPPIVQVPGGSSVSPPWYLDPNYWWAVILLVLAVWFLIKFVFGARFRAHIRNAVWAFMSGKIRAGFAYLMAASGMIHSDAADRLDLDK